jgi:hypothetical protein
LDEQELHSILFHHISDIKLTDLLKPCPGEQVTCRETSDHSILEGFPTIQVFSKLPTEVLGRHVVQA